MLTKIIDTRVEDEFITMVLEGGEFTDGDYRPRITIQIPARVSSSDTLGEIQRMVIEWAKRELSAQLV